ncbi:MAG: ribosome small subunit-dependent GTPase A [Planctomycetes bacterium]|nr:ribosome small subunit-dependent GTPase A [Planctomycetota bacterium]
MALNGTVVRLHGQHAWIRSDGTEYMCAVRGKFKQGKRKERSPLAVGDLVTFTPLPDGEENEGQLESIEERRTELYRAHPRFPRQRQVLAANIDLLVIVAGADLLSEQLLTVDRLLISAYSQGFIPLIVINKIDVVPRPELEPLLRDFAGVIDIEYVSASNGELGTLKGRFSGKTAVFAGPSGVGKSSIMNALEPGLGLRIGHVDKEGEGRHTTTHASLVPMAGGLVIDTPGVRDFGFWNLELHEISLYYPDWQTAREQCRFNTCTHRHEPGCGVKAAVEAGTISQGRYGRYMTILRESWNEQERLGY